ncbi:MAG: patatin-like phospholipase family protein [Clostridium sp.]
MEDISLVLEGGGLRGVYTAGVLDYFLDRKIDLKYCVGVSAGACQGASYITKQRQRNYRVNTEYLHDKEYLSFKNLITKGSMFGMEMLLNKIPRELDLFDYVYFRNCNVKYVVGTTDCETGSAKFYNIDDFDKADSIMQATISLPLVAKIVNYDGLKLLDGGISMPIPIKKAIEDGYKKHIVILTQHDGYRKDKTSTLPIMRVIYRKYPKLIEAMKNRHLVYNDTLEFISELENKGECLVIRPSSPLGIGRFEKDKKRLREIYSQGYEDGKMAEKKLNEFLGIN